MSRRIGNIFSIKTLRDFCGSPEGSRRPALAIRHRRAGPHFGLALLLAFTGAALGNESSALARGSQSSSEKPTLTRTKKRVARGRHWRISSKNGPIHVWVPAGYDRKTAGLVVYVHGYHVDADGAWKRHKLAQQFAKSRQNAMFLVPEAPRSNKQRVFWDALGDLKKTVRRAGMRLPNGPTVALAHSGGFRTIAHWVDNRQLAQVILLDAMYGRRKAFDEFISSGKRAKHHKMVIVGADTAGESKSFAKRFRYAVVRKNLPTSYAKLTRREKRAKLLYIRSQYGHGAMVKGGKVLPLLLRITPLRRL